MNWPSDFIDKVICGDCLEVMREIPDKSIDLVVTDPPYGINFCSSRTNRKAYIENDDFEGWLELMQKCLPEFKRILKDDGVCCCCCGGGATPVTAHFTLEAIKHFDLIQTLVWLKFIGLGWNYRPAYENILVLAKDRNKYNFYDESKKCSNVIEGINQEIPNSNEHPVQKPLRLMQKLLNIHSKEGDLILDPFLGSGTTAVAAKQLGRHFIGIEINPIYVKIAQERLKQEILKL